MLKFWLVFRSGIRAVSVVLDTGKQCVRIATHKSGKQCEWLIHTHISYRLLVEGSAPKPLLNTGFHSVATRSPNASEEYAKTPYPFGEGCNKS